MKHALKAFALFIFLVYSLCFADEVIADTSDIAQCGPAYGPFYGPQIYAGPIYTPRQNMRVMECSPCYRPASGIWNFRAEYLYFQPLFTQTYYAQGVLLLPIETPPPSGRRSTNDFNFKSAYRLYASYAFSGSEFQLIWTHLPKTSHSDTTTGPLLATSQIPLGGVFDFASSAINIEYFAVDGLAKFFGHQGRLFGYHFKGGLHYANILYDEVIIYRGVPPTVELHSRCHTWGIGPEVAFEAFLPLNLSQKSRCSGFGLVSSLKGSLLASHVNSRFNLDVSSISTEKIWNLVAMWDIRLGLQYGWNLTRFRTQLEVGYEMLSYHDAINKVFFSTPFTTSGLSIDLYSDANFHGPYVALEVVF